MNFVPGRSGFGIYKTSSVDSYFFPKSSSERTRLFFTRLKHLTIKNDLNMKFWQLAIGLSLFVILLGCGNDGSDRTAFSTDTSSKYVLTPVNSSGNYEAVELEYFHYKQHEIVYNLNGFRLGVPTNGASESGLYTFPEGQHLRVIANNEPARISNKRQFIANLSEGRNSTVAFPALSTGESIKTENAFSARRLNVREGTVFAHSDMGHSMLVYNLPDGTYKGKFADRVLLDFYLIEAPISGAYKVYLDINNEERYVLDRWQAYTIQGLKNGENTIKLTLVYNNGDIADIPFNPVERKITIER